MIEFPIKGRARLMKNRVMRPRRISRYGRYSVVKEAGLRGRTVFCVYGRNTQGEDVFKSLHVTVGGAMHAAEEYAAEAMQKELVAA